MDLNFFLKKIDCWLDGYTNGWQDGYKKMDVWLDGHEKIEGWLD